MTTASYRERGILPVTSPIGTPISSISLSLDGGRIALPPSENTPVEIKNKRKNYDILSPQNTPIREQVKTEADINSKIYLERAKNKDKKLLEDLKIKEKELLENEAKFYLKSAIFTFYSAIVLILFIASVSIFSQILIPALVCGSLLAWGIYTFYFVIKGNLREEKLIELYKEQIELKTNNIKIQECRLNFNELDMIISYDIRKKPPEGGFSKDLTPLIGNYMREELLSEDKDLLDRKLKEIDNIRRKCESISQIIIQSRILNSLQESIFYKQKKMLYKMQIALDNNKITEREYQDILKKMDNVRGLPTALELNELQEKKKELQEKKKEIRLEIKNLFIKQFKELNIMLRIYGLEGSREKQKELMGKIRELFLEIVENRKNKAFKYYISYIHYNNHDGSMLYTLYFGGMSFIFHGDFFKGCGGMCVNRNASGDQFWVGPPGLSF